MQKQLDKHSGMPPIFVVGATYVDVVLFTSEQIGLDCSVGVREQRCVLGGPGFSWAMELRRLNHPVSFATVVGTCPWSNKALYRMKHSGLQVFAQVRRNRELDHSFVIMDRSNGKLAVSDRRISPSLRWTKNLATMVKRVGALVITSALPLAQIRTILDTLPPDIFLVLAPNKNMCREIATSSCRHLLRRVDYLTLNTEEFSILEPTDEIPLITVTKGGAGGILISKGRRGRFAPHPERIEQPVSTNGAGEAFGAAFLSALLTGHKPSEAISMAAENAYRHIINSHSMLTHGAKL